MASLTCKHVPKVRVSSAENLIDALNRGLAIASVLSCDRPDCVESAKVWVREHSSYEPAVVPLGRPT